MTKLLIIIIVIIITIIINYYYYQYLLLLLIMNPFSWLKSFARLRMIWTAHLLTLCMKYLSQLSCQFLRRLVDFSDISWSFRNILLLN